jgi:hypothetical protein
MQEPTRPGFVGRPKLVERYERTSSIEPAGVLATAWYVQRKADVFSGRRETHQVKSQNPVAGIACVEETKRMESIDKAIYGMVSKSSGCNESERIGYLETQKTQRPNLTCRGEGNMDRRRLTDAARRSGGAVATAR